MVPIVPDEARTFGMDSLFRELKIYASQGQLYEPVDAQLLLSYAEAQNGQILEEGITEAGSMASWIAAATSYAHRGVPMVPFFIFYSMFGFQRIGDLMWLAGDARARGFLLGATAGRTTLAGEGLQHQDGHSLVLASTNPAVESYDPAFAYEVGTIIEHGLKRMYGDSPEDLYLLPHPLQRELSAASAPRRAPRRGSSRGSIAGAPAPSGTLLRRRCCSPAPPTLPPARLRSSWPTTTESASSSGRRRPIRSCGPKRFRSIGGTAFIPGEPPKSPAVTRILSEAGGPIVAVSDFMKMVPDQIARYVPGAFTTLGTDGFGRSDSRTQPAPLLRDRRRTRGDRGALGAGQGGQARSSSRWRTPPPDTGSIPRPSTPRPSRSDRGQALLGPIWPARTGIPLCCPPTSADKGPSPQGQETT